MRYLATALVIVLAGCAFQPGSGVSPSFAQSWGCNYDEVMARADEVKANLSQGQYYVPQVGWSACELLARVGRPQDVDRQTSRRSMSATWWYRDGSDVHMIRLVPSAQVWEVDYVGW